MPKIINVQHVLHIFPCVILYMLLIEGIRINVLWLKTNVETQYSATMQKRKAIRLFHTRHFHSLRMNDDECVCYHLLMLIAGWRHWFLQEAGMYNLHVTGKTPFHFLNAESNRTKYIPPSNSAPCYCVLLPPTGDAVCVCVTSYRSWRITVQNCSCLSLASAVDMHLFRALFMH